MEKMPLPLPLPPPTSPPPPPWAELPLEITAIILQKLGALEILRSAQMVCKTWRSVSLDPALWRVIYIDSYVNSDSDLPNLCRLAVDRSRGQLLDITIIFGFFASDHLLNYIALRSGQLRRLQLVSCSFISSEGLSEAVKRLPVLEELQIFYIKLTKEAIEAVGRSCPLLASFGLNNQGSRRPQLDCDEEAFAIAENMPALRHLQLFGNKMTNEGLEAILDGCPLLESIDLRQCFNISLAGSLGRRCSQQIKLLKRPNDSTEDYGFDTRIEDYESSDEDCLFGFSDIELMSVDNNDYYEFSDLDSDYCDHSELFIE